ncbi:MAG: 50S ribosomal protein L17 [Candidatus Magasanikbacteria bacterium RIFCSPHIGHO2_01_FULL_41_23]|uniref:50S ribosomal protein L17 n=1 Tax=Candidatus Magasanikbacteria bacterium RIFCSPLOWO2_01_FULL_40_15 TaxID=1798686 RepID=A0A1F6N253_9BACT|nr:MAG: 50S ribosomal protein L17 [Candidatus Magasanikbacteria bacterium RIFCSPHIGHO2_01_FULL_41_23]OGH76466.1 MAG: 50S ribosomal protein L17 [Candidatus Magasanikbacteria bacterium RIFCSPHIGHO2_12_FULL_41_16]OGH77952.1 MAG: 50S ribosomal protein L17 [Candidatus Magasanikbacteria bacterium RIFCSPLOWO2_01_FULL_40_15]
MRHQKKNIKLGRERGSRIALLRSLTESFILHEAITTTKAKAKALKSIVEPLITKAKRKQVSDMTAIVGFLYTKKAITKLVKEIAPRYTERRGGYTRVTKLGNRFNDSADMVRIEFV